MRRREKVFVVIVICLVIAVIVTSTKIFGGVSDNGLPAKKDINIVVERDVDIDTESGVDNQ